MNDRIKGSGENPLPFPLPLQKRNVFMRETPKRISRVMETAVEAKENKEDVLSRMTALRNSLGTVILHKFTGLKLGKKQKVRKPIDSVRFPHYNENRKKRLGFRGRSPICPHPRGRLFSPRRGCHPLYHPIYILSHTKD